MSGTLHATPWQVRRLVIEAHASWSEQHTLEVCDCDGNMVCSLTNRSDKQTADTYEPLAKLLAATAAWLAAQFELVKAKLREVAKREQSVIS